MPLVSVIIPVYNSEQYLSKCLDTVLNQSLKNIEVICVDDGSTDNSLEILHNYKSIDKRIRIVSQKHHNAGAARNKGMEISKGEFLSFLDSDDYFELNMLEKMYESAKKDKSIDIIVSRAKQFKDEKEGFEEIDWNIRQELLPTNNPFNISEIKTDVFYVFMGWAWDKLFRSEFIKKYGIEFQSLTKQNDGYFVFCSLLKANKIYVLNDYFIYHRKRDGSLEKSDNENNNYLCYISMLTEIKKQLNQWGIYEKYRQDFNNYGLLISRMISRALNQKNKGKLYHYLKNKGLNELDIKKRKKEYYYREDDYYFHLGIIYGRLYRLFVCIKDNGIIYTVTRALSVVNNMQK